MGMKVPGIKEGRFVFSDPNLAENYTMKEF